MKQIVLQIFVEDLIAEKGGNGNKKNQDKNPNKYRKFYKCIV